MNIFNRCFYPNFKYFSIETYKIIFFYLTSLKAFSCPIRNLFWANSTFRCSRSVFLVWVLWVSRWGQSCSIGKKVYRWVRRALPVSDSNTNQESDSDSKSSYFSVFYFSIKGFLYFFVRDL